MVLLNGHRLRYVSRPALAIAVLLLSCALVLVWWFLRGVEVSLPSVSSPQSQRFPCVSYSPFRHPNINPFNYLAKVTPAQIRADLALLKTRTDCIRTYGLTQGLDAVPAVAKELGMRVRLGVWLARDAAQNQAQLMQGLALAKRYPEVIDLLIVGNEVLLRKELTAPQLAQILSQAQALSPVPVTYADVWEFWQRHSELAKHVDLVTVHILPYWEDKPVAVRDAAKHVQEVGRKMQQFFAGKPVWIGETGWPAAGRQRDGAVPGRVEQSAFMRDLMLLRPAIGLDFNVIEAFDQPWKRSFEGAMGGYWGLFDAQGQARVSLSGAVVEDAQWWRGFVGAGLGALMGVLSAGVMQRLMRSWSVWGWSVGCIGGGLIGAICAVQILMSTWWDRSPFEQTVSLALGSLGAASAALSLTQLVFAHHRWLIEPAQKTIERWVGRAADAARLGVLFCAATAALVLLLDPRYRPFPWWWFLAPAASWLALRRGAPQRLANISQQTQFLACALAAFAVALVIQEGWRNVQALTYGLLLLSLAAVAALPALPALATFPALPALAKTRAANKAAGAPSSVE